MDSLNPPWPRSEIIWFEPVGRSRYRRFNGPAEQFNRTSGAELMHSTPRSLHCSEPVDGRPELRKLSSLRLKSNLRLCLRPQLTPRLQRKIFSSGGNDSVGVAHDRPSPALASCFAFVDSLALCLDMGVPRRIDATCQA